MKFLVQYVIWKRFPFFQSRNIPVYPLQGPESPRTIGAMTKDFNNFSAR